MEVPARALRRLSSREYNNVVRDLLGDDSGPADAFGPDVFQGGYDNGETSLAVQSDQVAAYQAAAERLAERALGSPVGRRRVLGRCAERAASRGRCTSEFLGGFAVRAFRRPLTDGERQRLAEVIELGAAGGDLADGMQLALEVILQSPQFLYREELGAAAPVERDADGQPVVRLSDFEVASELSFLLTGSQPDDALWAAVWSGRLRTGADRRREAERLLGTPSARRTLRAFVHQWLGTDRLATLSKDPAAYPAFSPALSRSMSAELDALYEDALWGGSGSLRRLFTTPTAWVDAELAPTYRVVAEGGALRPVELAAAQRPGVLTRAGFLAVHGTASDSGPIGRGVFVLDRLLCRAPAPPPGRVPPLPAASDGTGARTTRQRVEQHTSTPFCQGCHAAINGAGFPLEAFDGVGREREREAGQPVDTRGELRGVGDADGAVSGAAELAARIGGSRQLSQCFARQVWRFAHGRVEGSAARLSWLAWRAHPDGRMLDLLLDVVEDESFVVRRLAGPGDSDGDGEEDRR